MKLPALSLMLATVALALCSCETADGGRKKKRPRPMLPGEEDSSLSWSRPTKSSEISSPFGLPTSR